MHGDRDKIWWFPTFPYENGFVYFVNGIRKEIQDEQHIRQSKYDSGRSTLYEISDVLNSNHICSIWGNGATSLAKKLTVFLRGKGSYGRIAMVTVPPKPDWINIKKDIMQQIQREGMDNWTLILDGFWWNLTSKDVEAIGIDSISKYFRLVFCSRNEMCTKLINHITFRINLLEDEEAWDLFTEQAGKTIVDLDLTETARKIVDECNGCRIVVLSIASALKDKPANVWAESLKKLQISNQTQSSEEEVFSKIRLSYDLLGDKEAQSLFHICCLFPEDFNVPVEDLVMFGKGLQLFENVDSMNQARHRVKCIVHKLINSFFLLDVDGEDFVKVHNMCRDFGVWTSRFGKHPYSVRCENSMKGWLLHRWECERSSAISIMCKTIKQHPSDLRCPNLQLLQLSYGRDSAQLPNGIFEGLQQNLKVLSLNIPALSQSVTVLKRLRTLCVTESTSNNSNRIPRPRIGDLLSDEMKDLEIFSFSTARPYRDFPAEIGLLCNLRILRFNPERLRYIPPGVLSKLERLEELHLPLDFIGWGRKEEGDGERMNASLSEIESLQLTAIRIGVSSKGSISAEMFVKKLTRFHVFIGSHVSPEYEFGTCGKSERSLEVFDVDADDFTESWIGALIWKSESLRLKQVRNLKNIVTCQPKEDGNIEFPQWKNICISDCKELEYIGEGQIPGTFFSQLKSLKLFGLYNLKEIWHGFHFSNIKGSRFGNLSEIQILFCGKLKYVFPLPMATELRQLQSLRICFCDEMETIFHSEQMENDRKSTKFSLTSNSITKRLFGRGKKTEHIASQRQMKENTEKEEDKGAAKDAVLFPRLKTMEFAKMDLQIFYDGNHSILLPSLESLSIFQCHHLKAFSNGLIETPLLKRILINGNRYPVTKDLNETVKNLKW